MIEHSIFEELREKLTSNVQIGRGDDADDSYLYIDLQRSRSFVFVIVVNGIMKMAAYARGRLTNFIDCDICNPNIDPVKEICRYVDTCLKVVAAENKRIKPRTPKIGKPMEDEDDLFKPCK